MCDTGPDVRRAAVRFCDQSAWWSSRLDLGYWGDVVATTGPRVCIQVIMCGQNFRATDVNIPGMV